MNVNRVLLLTFLWKDGVSKALYDIFTFDACSLKILLQLPCEKSKLDFTRISWV